MMINKNLEQFIADHQAEPELEIPKVMAEAKEEINNDGDKTRSMRK